MNATTNKLPQAVLYDDDFRDHKLNKWIDKWPEGLDDERWLEYKKDWIISTNVPLEEGKIVLWLDEFFQKDEQDVESHEMMVRATIMGNCAGQLHAQELLYRKAIPKEWREFCLVFPGTIWEKTIYGDESSYDEETGYDDITNMYVLCMYYGDNGWHPYFLKYYGLSAQRFPSNCRLVRIVK